MLLSFQEKKHHFPSSILKKWQKLIDLLSSTFDIPATLIMQVKDERFRVFASSNTDTNPFVVGDFEKMTGSYCEEVVRTKSKFHIYNALVNSKWDCNPDLKYGMVAYFGFPIFYPNGDVYGTLCILDNKVNRFSDMVEEFLKQVKEIIELDIAVHLSYETTSENLEKEIAENFNIGGKRRKSVYELERELEQQKDLQKILNDKLCCFDDELLKRDTKYKTLFESMNSAIEIFESIFDKNGDLCDAKYLDINPKNEEIIGYKKEEVIGKTLLEIFPDTDNKWLRHFDSVLKNEESMSFDSYFKPLNKHLSVSAFPIEGNIFGISYHDITERVLTKQKLFDSEKRYKTLFNKSSSVMLLVDPDTKNIIDANSAAIDFYGFYKEDLLGMSMTEINIMSPKDLQKEINLAAASKKNHFQFEHQLASGEIRNVEVYSSPIFANGETLLFSVIHDITKRRIALEEISRLSIAVEQSPVSVVITDTNGTIVYCNPIHCEITGYSIKEMLGENPRILKSGKYNKEVYAGLWKTICNGDKWSGEFFNKKKDGSFYWESASIAPIKNDKNEIISYVKIGADISEKKRLENQLKQSKLKAEESDRLKSSFLSNLSHEIRTPLNGIMGFTNLMISDDISAKERKEYGAFIESAGQLLMRTMDDILRLSEIEAGKMSVKYSRFNFKELFQEMEDFYASEIDDKGLELQMSCSCTIQIWNDRKRIRQIFDNLIRNAIKFTDKGRIHIKAEYTGEMLVLSVHDTGIGLDSEHHMSIFEHFSQVDSFTRREFEGTGLGLAISKEIVTLLGGDIWVESELGKGAKFIFTIPLRKENNELESESS